MKGENYLRVKDMSSTELRLRSKLTPKQRKFADNYIESGSALKSAINAGYSKNYAHANTKKLLENVGIHNYITERMKTISNNKVAKQKEVMEFLTSCLRGDEKDTIAAGNKIYKVPISLKDRIKAAEQIGKRYAMWTDKVDSNVSGSIELEGLKNLSTADLKKLAEDKPEPKFDYSDYEKK